MSCAYSLQGTNAHLILGKASAAVARSPARAWQPRRYWHAPLPHALLHTALASPDQACVWTQATLDRPSVAYLKDCMVGLLLFQLPYHATLCGAACVLGGLPRAHSPHLEHGVQVHGRSMVPSAALLEAACATSSALIDDGATRALALTDASFGAAVVHEPCAVVECQLHVRIGSLQLCSRQADRSATSSTSTGEGPVHLACHAAAAQDAAVLTAPGGRVTRSILADLDLDLLCNMPAQAPPADACTADVHSVPLSAAALQGGYRLHPAAAEAATALHSFTNRGPAHRPSCCLCRPASCGALLCNDRQAANRRLRSCTASARRRRSGTAGRQRGCVRAQRCGSQMAFQIVDLVLVSADVAVSHTNDYMTTWQHIPEPAETPTVR